MLLQHLHLLLSLFALSSISSPVARRRASPPISSHVSHLTRARSTIRTSSKWLQNQLVGQTVLDSLNFDERFAVDITVGTQDFTVAFDTGSSDTWLAGTGFTCINQTTGDTVPEADCQFGSTFTPDSTFQQIPGENFRIRYGDGSGAAGILGYDTVTIAGIQVPQQEIGVVTIAGWVGEGDNVTAGLTGFSWPAITNAYVGTNISADNLTNPSSHLPYSSIVNSIFFVDNLTAPLFSLSLSRNPSVFGFGGYLTIGGIPNPCLPTINASDTFATTPMLQTAFNFPEPTYEFYAISIDGLVYGNYAPGSAKSATTFIVDSGTTLDYVPTDDCIMLNSLFNPPAYNSSEYGIFLVQCNASVPTFGVTISGETFYHNPVDLIFQSPGLPDGICISGIQDGGSFDSSQAIYILGDTFQKNVLSVFDVGNKEMAFSARPYYASG